VLTLPNVVPAALRSTVINSLITNIQTNGFITSGIIGVDNIYPFLSLNGYHDLALQMISVTRSPSFGYMSNNPIQNATTVWEQLSLLPDHPDSSLNHHMFSSVGAWFYRYLAGINLNGLEMIEIHPRMNSDLSLLNQVEAEVNTIKGRIEVVWRRLMGVADNPTTLYLSVTIPATAKGKIILEPTLPNGRCQSIRESGQVLWLRGENYEVAEKVEGINSLSEDQLNGKISLSVESGSYDLIAEWAEADPLALY